MAHHHSGGVGALAHGAWRDHWLDVQALVCGHERRKRREFHRLNLHGERRRLRQTLALKHTHRRTQGYIYPAPGRHAYTAVLRMWSPHTQRQFSDLDAQWSEIGPLEPPRSAHDDCSFRECFHRKGAVSYPVPAQPPKAPRLAS
jgi:hypothetical protein